MIHLGQMFQLSIGHSARIIGKNALIRFLEVTEDSRCPQGLDCFHPGQVRIRLEVIRTGTEESFAFELVKKGNSANATMVHAGGMKYFLHEVLPPPKAGVELRRGDYIIQMTITESD